MYCNTAVWGFKANGRPAGKSNHEKNFNFPHSPTMCEIRWVEGKQLTRICGRDPKTGKLRSTHQGNDCRGPSSKGGINKVLAVEDGRVNRVKNRGAGGNGYVYITGSKSKIQWKYRHIDGIRVKRNQVVKRGDQIATIADIKSTPVHLHLECLVRQQLRDCFPSLMTAYMRRRGIAYEIRDGKLAFNDCYEIRRGEKKPRRFGMCSEKKTISDKSRDSRTGQVGISGLTLFGLH